MPIRHLSLVTLALLVVGLFHEDALGSATTDARAHALDLAQKRLAEAHWTLAQGIVDVEAELQRVAGSHPGAEALLKSYRAQFNRELARVREMGRGTRPVLSGRDGRGDDDDDDDDDDLQASFLEQVDEVHLRALKLSSNLSSFGLPRVHALEAEAYRVSLAPVGTSSCYGSIAGTVQGPGGPLDGVSVVAYTADGLVAGSAITDGIGAARGDYQIDNLLAGQEYYIVTTNADALIDEVFDDVVCVGGTCDPTLGSAVAVSAGVTTSGIDFVLTAGGQIGGILTSQDPLALGGLLLTVVNIFDATGVLVTSAAATLDMNTLDVIYLTEGGLPAGTYHVVTASLYGFLDELYDGLPCPSGGTCDPTTGTPVVVTVPNLTTGIDIELATGGNITGTITDSGTSQPLANILVGAHDSTGQLISFGSSDATGVYTLLAGLAAGNYFVATGNLSGYVDELYNDIPCTGGLCTITSGDQVAVTMGATTGAIDFALSTGGTFSGRVTRADNGTPLADVFILGHTAAGDLVGTATTDANGDYTLLNGLGTGSYRATTLNALGLEDELFNDMSCPGGTCDVTVGTPIPVTIGLDTPDVDFDLVGDTITACSFEGCSTCALTVYP